MYRRVLSILVVLLMAAPASGGGVHGRVGVEDLRVERKAEPVGIDLDRPRFSWVIESRERDVEQRSYRVRVSSRREDRVGQRPRPLARVGGRRVRRPDAGGGHPLRVARRRADQPRRRHRELALPHRPVRRGRLGGQRLDRQRAPAARRRAADLRRRLLDLDAGGDAPRSPRPSRARSGYTLPAVKAAASAEIVITADDSYRLWVNGRLLGSTAGAENEWQQSRRFETALDPARNVIAVRTTNGAGSPAGLIANAPRPLHRRLGGDPRDRRGLEGGQDVPGGLLAHRTSTTRAGAPRSCRRPTAAGRGAATCARRATRPGPRRCCGASSRSAGACATRRCSTPPAATRTSRSTARPRARTCSRRASPTTTTPSSTRRPTSRDRLKPGTNALGVELGRGFYGMTGGNVWRWESPPWHDEPVVRARLRIEYEDGRVQDVVTDDGWRIADGPTVFDDLYGGETYDARLAVDGFDRPGFDDHAWAPASEVAGPKGVLVNQRQQPIRVTESLPAVAITEPAPDVYVVKFPRVLAGWVELAASGPAGTTIRAQYGEKLLANGRPDFSNNGGFQSGFQTDRFILAGTGATERWHARFSYKGFQYIEVTGWPGDAPPPLSAFTAQAVHTDVADDRLVRELERADEPHPPRGRRHDAQQPPRHPHRHADVREERLDRRRGARARRCSCSTSTSHELFAKWMRDVHETREANGRPLVIAPSSGDWGVWGIAPPWHSAYVLIPEWLDQYGGDRRVLDRALRRDEALRRPRVRHGQRGRDRRQRAARRLGQPRGEPGGRQRARGPARLGHRLPVHDAAQRGAQREARSAAPPTRRSSPRAPRRSRRRSTSASWTAPPATTAAPATAATARRTTCSRWPSGWCRTPRPSSAWSTASPPTCARSGDTLNTGVLGTKYLLPVLTEHGHADLAQRLATQTKYPSWGYMIENGATSMWEHWALEARSRGHYFLGTVDDWYFHHVAGIRASQTTGYRDDHDRARPSRASWTGRARRRARRTGR